MTVHSRRRLGGFSMVEFLVAAFILAIGLLGLIALQVSAVAAATAGRGRTTAVYIADQILQRAQVEGQYSYLAKSTGVAVSTSFVPLFTASPGTAIDATTFGGFNVDGVQVTQMSAAVPPATGTVETNVANLATQVPDVNKRSKVFTASWARRAYAGTAPTSPIQSQEFVANVAWVEGTQNKYLSMSRTVRY